MAISFNFNMPFKLILRQDVRTVFYMLEWKYCTFWKIDGNHIGPIHQNYTMALRLDQRTVGKSTGTGVSRQRIYTLPDQAGWKMEKAYTQGTLVSALRPPPPFLSPPIYSCTCSLCTRVPLLCIIHVVITSSYYINLHTTSTTNSVFIQSLL